MKSIWYKSHNLGVSELPLFEIIIFLELVAGLLTAFLMTLLSLPQLALISAVINYCTYAYNMEVIKILIQKMPVTYKCSQKAYLRYCAFLALHKSDLLLLGLSRTLFLLLFAVTDVRLLTFAAVDVLISASILLFLLLDSTMRDISAKALLAGILILSYLSLEKLPPTALAPGFAALSAVMLLLCAAKIQEYRKTELLKGKEGKPLKNLMVSFLFKGSCYNLKKNISYFVTLTGTGIAIHHFNLRVGISGLFFFLTFLEALIYTRVRLYEKNIGYSPVLFYSQRRSAVAGVFLGHFPYHCFTLVLSLIVLIIGGFMPSPLQIAACALWFFFLSLYVTKISEKIVSYREKRPRFIEEYVAFMGSFWAGFIP